MSFLKNLRGRATSLPQDITNGYIWFLKNSKALLFDVDGQRVRINPPADWEESHPDSPAYIDNKPPLGTASSHDVAAGINQSQDLPTSKQVYDAVRNVSAEIEATKSMIGTPLIANGIAEMSNTSKIYVYNGSEDGFVNGDWYYFDGTDWIDGGVYNSVAVSTDTTLLINGKPADAAATGNFIAELQGATEELYTKIDNLTADVDMLSVRADSFFNELDVTSDGLVYGAQDGTRLNGPYGPFAGGGGGGGGGGGESIDAVFSADNNTGWTTKTVSTGADEVYFSFYWESLEDGMASGGGTVTVIVNNITKGTLSVSQGNVQVALMKYCDPGANKIRIRIADQYDQAKSWIITLNIIDLTITSSFDTSFPFTDTISFPYTPNGVVSKVVYFVLDGNVIGTNTTNVSGRQLTYLIPAQTHGSHTLDVYFESVINDETVRSNTLHYEFICVRDGVGEVVITSPFMDYNQNQYATVSIPYVVYDPMSLQTSVQIFVNDSLVQTLTVDRSQHTFTYKANIPGNINITFASGSARKTIPLVVTESDVHIEAETESLVLHLSAEGRSNSEDTRDVWEYGDYSAQFNNFDWNLDGWHKDNDGVDALRTVGDARLVIPYKPFASNIINKGMTIEIDFSTDNVVDYGTNIISCFTNNVGFNITPQTVTFQGPQTSLMSPFKENEHIRLTIVIEKQTSNRLILFYLNGVMSSAVQYASGENFAQGREENAAAITVGSNACAVNIYTVRFYNNDLSRSQVVNNWIADTQFGDVMLERYNHNNIFDDTLHITPNSLPSDLPYFIINGPELPQYKGDKKTVSGSFTDQENPNKSFTFEGCQINVQGTSSQAYFRKNYDLQFKKGFEMRNGHADKYSIINAIPFNRFVLKADVASSESANNTLLTMFFNDTSPYKCPEMVANPQVRMGIEGRPAVLFWYNTSNQTTEFLGR